MKANTRKTKLELWIYAFKKTHENFYLGEHNTAMIKSLLHSSGVFEHCLLHRQVLTHKSSSITEQGKQKGESGSGGKDEERET